MTKVFKSNTTHYSLFIMVHLVWSLKEVYLNVMQVMLCRALVVENAFGGWEGGIASGKEL